MQYTDTNKEVWVNKINQIMTNYDSQNPTIVSVMLLLNSMLEEYERYKSIGTIEEFKLLKYKSIVYEKDKNNESM